MSKSRGIKQWIMSGVLLLCISAPVCADEVIVEGGVGFYKSYNSEAAFLRYQKYVSPFFGFGSFYDLAIATWSGPTRKRSSMSASTACGGWTNFGGNGLWKTKAVSNDSSFPKGWLTTRSRAIEPHNFRFCIA